MDLKLAGNVAVVLGAARGLGRAIAAALMAEGAQVGAGGCGAGGENHDRRIG